MKNNIKQTMNVIGSNARKANSKLAIASTNNNLGKAGSKLSLLILCDNPSIDSDVPCPYRSNIFRLSFFPFRAVPQKRRIHFWTFLHLVDPFQARFQDYWTTYFWICGNMFWDFS